MLSDAPVRLSEGPMMLSMALSGAQRALSASHGTFQDFRWPCQALKRHIRLSEGHTRL
jgi:hypothetical protein